MTNVLMLAAEHGALKGGKVGGIGDVIEQLPPALVTAGMKVDVLLPSYGVYHRSEGAELEAERSVEFAGTQQTVRLYRLPAQSGAGCLVVDHPLFAAPAGQIYHHDPDNQPFATDANIYALFCASAAALLIGGELQVPEVVHLHDWHAATFAVLARDLKALQSLHLVYTIHNLALQGTRPLAGHPSSFTSWFPDYELDISKNPVAEFLRDPQYVDCYNPTRAAIRLADRIHVVSPTYAQEILEANDLTVGLHGGEGLEFDLQARADEGHLVGILNGCHYPEGSSSPADLSLDSEAQAQGRKSLLRTTQRTLGGWLGSRETLRSSDYLARETLASLSSTIAGRFLVTSVGRVTDQKVGLLLHRAADGNSTLLDRLLEELGEHGCLLMLGSGDAGLEQQLVEHAARHRNYVFMRGYSERLADAFYDAGDLFLMPSLFEPCGISQLMAMRAGQPCLVHATGGLKDTVVDETDGFLFDGFDLDEKARNCEQALKRALRLRANPRGYREMRSRARAKRVTWAAAAAACVQQLYRPTRSWRRKAI